MKSFTDTEFNTLPITFDPSMSRGFSCDKGIHDLLHLHINKGLAKKAAALYDVDEENLFFYVKEPDSFAIHFNKLVVKIGYYGTVRENSLTLTLNIDVRGVCFKNIRDTLDDCDNEITIDEVYFQMEVLKLTTSYLDRYGVTVTNKFS